ncbi:transposase, partial [Phragmitibacter flavus]
MADLNAMALHKRLCTSRPWLEALCIHVLGEIRSRLGEGPDFWLPGRQLRVLDASDIQEPGATGTDWRLHYSLRLPQLCCDFFEITSKHGGESLRRLPVQQGDLVLADRAYNDRKAIASIKAAGADVIVRYNSGALPLEDKDEKPWEPLPVLRSLVVGQMIECPVWLRVGKEPGQVIPARLCALRKTPEAAAKAERKARYKARCQKSIRPATLELAHYVVVITTLSAQTLDCTAVLEFYRARWQVELAFKRLKSLLQMGQLPKHKEASSRAWMQGKILVALLIERMMCEARYFSPWGYPLRRTPAVES